MRHLVGGREKLLLLMVICLMVAIVMVEATLVLGPPNYFINRIILQIFHIKKKSH